MKTKEEIAKMDSQQAYKYLDMFELRVWEDIQEEKEFKNLLESGVSEEHALETISLQRKGL